MPSTSSRRGCPAWVAIVQASELFRAGREVEHDGLGTVSRPRPSRRRRARRRAPARCHPPTPCCTGAFRVESTGLAGQGSRFKRATDAQQFWPRAGVLVGQWPIPGAADGWSSQSHPDLRRCTASLLPAYNDSVRPGSPCRRAAVRAVPRELCCRSSAGTLKWNADKGTADRAFSFEGIGKFAPQSGGYGGRSRWSPAMVPRWRGGRRRAGLRPSWGRNP